MSDEYDSQFNMAPQLLVHTSIEVLVDDTCFTIIRKVLR